MMKLNSFRDLMQQVGIWFKAYQQAYEKLNPPTIYRLLEVKKNQKNEDILVIHVVGTAQSFQCTALEVVRDDRLLEGFSKQDVRNISYYAQQALNTKKYTIATQVLDGEKTKFRLMKLNEDKFVEKTAQEIALDENLVKSMSSHDALTVGYVNASERLSEIYKLKQKK